MVLFQKILQQKLNGELVIKYEIINNYLFFVNYRSTTLFNNYKKKDRKKGKNN